jgi:hypothetical protein
VARPRLPASEPRPDDVRPPGVNLTGTTGGRTGAIAGLSGGRQVLPGVHQAVVRRAVPVTRAPGGHLAGLSPAPGSRGTDSCVARPRLPASEPRPDDVRPPGVNLTGTTGGRTGAIAGLSGGRLRQQRARRMSE